MPELPEVETIRRQLDDVLPGQVLESVTVWREKSFAGEVDGLIGKKVISVERRAKVLRINLDGDDNLLVHLKMTGQLIYQGLGVGSRESGKDRIVGGHPTNDWIGSLPSKHTRVVLRFTGGALYFNDQRVFGWVKSVKDDGLEQEHVNFGPDIIDRKLVSDSYFYGQLQRSASPVKIAILDQKRIAGVGNIYANDGLWDAKIDPRRPAKSLSKTEAKRLLVSLRKVMELGLELGGASETNFVHLDGLGGTYQDHFLTYKKDGERCARKGCGGVLEKVKLGGRGTFFCRICQI